MYYAKTEATMNLDDLKAYKLVRKENLVISAQQATCFATSKQEQE